MGRAFIESKSIRECVTCHQITLIKGHERCAACWSYFRMFQKERTPEIIQAAAQRKKRAKWCIVCGDLSVHCKERCKPCYIYWRWHGWKKERPRHIWDKDAPCKNCGRPLSVSRGSNGLCVACYHFDRTDRVRPRELWGIGEHGWCECGNPGTIVQQGVVLCAHCEKEFI